MPSTASPKNGLNAINLHPYRTHNQLYPSAIQAATPTNVRKHSAHNETISNQMIVNEPSSKLGDDINKISSTLAPITGLPSKGLEAYLQEQEERLIITALKQTKGNKTQAAELLGTTFRSLRYRMKKLEIDDEQHSD